MCNSHPSFLISLPLSLPPSPALPHSLRQKYEEALKAGQAELHALQEQQMRLQHKILEAPHKEHELEAVKRVSPSSLSVFHLLPVPSSIVQV